MGGPDDPRSLKPIDLTNICQNHATEGGAYANLIHPRPPEPIPQRTP